MDTIKGYHAHVYFDATSVDPARALCAAVRDRFGAQMGRVHERPVGPHPMWSCQLAFEPEAFAQIIPWLALNRQGLTVFIHPDTGDDLKDHRDHAIWMGAMPALKLEMFDKKDG
ncbi:DOPA 4,5-dioxygenase family protein [Aestuariivita sp.]|jgi:DOPA 4,5-dioxygenase|uniref:DOPA 4,5-dioxygenase family protein n=1 Tax=Aestuariivita sp. TaxID=1872407 RepID=UPI00217043ED|nr:DOPA 4,5-dioxygenase family protein [Aestuariivita sp.]MCE8007766.1 DOPA 4,5-dioxygenase family protein [Aestuariivita sp.]